ncbi:hypothetical protein [Haloferula sargassicola]|uniref:hypothetical protein n=1 Tax=Haloferula sargassicola TaxID=490096 RepID=UPI003365AA91
MNKVICGITLAMLIGLSAWHLFLRGGRVIAVGPDGAPIEGAEVWVSYVSAPALLQGVTDAKGRAEIPPKRVRRGGWHSIIVTWDDPQGIRYLGQNSEGDPKFPLTIPLTKRP